MDRRESPRLRTSARRDDGASAVEFALVLPILLVLVFGVIDYGWWFGETLGLRSGVREAARLGAVNEAGTSAESVKSLMVQRSPQLAGGAAELDVAVRIFGPGAEGGVPGTGSTLLICASMPGESITGLGDTLYPFPDTHSTEAAMRLEKAPVLLSDSQTANWVGTCSLTPSVAVAEGP